MTTRKRVRTPDATDSTSRYRLRAWLDRATLDEVQTLAAKVGVAASVLYGWGRFVSTPDSGERSALDVATTGHIAAGGWESVAPDDVLHYSAQHLPPAEALTRWLDEEKGRLARLSKDLRVSREAIRQWCRGEARPRIPEMRQALERLTYGTVRADQWETPDELRERLRLAGVAA